MCVNQKKESSICGTKLSPTVAQEKPPCFIPSSRMSSRLFNLTTLGKDFTTIGITRTLSRIDRIFINLPMVEARDFHCYSRVFENLGILSILNDHAAVRLVFEKSSNREQLSNRFQVECPISSFFLYHFELASGTTDTLLTRLARSQISKKII